MIFVNSLAVIANLALGVYLLRKYRDFGLWFGFWIFLQNWSLISCWYNDLGIYNFELFRYTETTLATTRLALFSIVFNIGYWFAMKRLSGFTPVRRDYTAVYGLIKIGHIRLLGYAAIAAVIAYVGYSFATEGIPVDA